MSYSQQYISDQVEDPAAIIELLYQIGDLGFNLAKEKLTVLALYQTTEGYDRYQKLLQHLQVDGLYHHHSAILSFTFRSILEELEMDFKLNDIEVKLYVLEEGKPKGITEKSYSKTTGFPAKEQMIKETIEKAINLSRAKSTSIPLRSPLEKLGTPLNIIKPRRQ